MPASFLPIRFVGRRPSFSTLLLCCGLVPAMYFGVGTLDGFLVCLGAVVISADRGTTPVDLCCRAVCLAIAVAMLAERSDVGWFDAGRCWLVLASVDGAALALISPTPTKKSPFYFAVVMLAAIAWLTLPLWMSWTLLDGNVARRLIAVHPLFAMNSAVESLGVWTELPVPYGVVRLGQDIPYSLPMSVVPCVVLHGFVALIAAATKRAWRSREHTSIKVTANGFKG